MKGNREIGVVVNGRIMMGYLCFTYTPVSTVEFCFSLPVAEQRSELGRISGRERSVYSLSIVYHCSIHNLPTFRFPSFDAVCCSVAHWVASHRNLENYLFTERLPVKIKRINIAS